MTDPATTRGPPQNPEEPRGSTQSSTQHSSVQSPTSGPGRSYFQGTWRTPGLLQGVTPSCDGGFLRDWDDGKAFEGGGDLNFSRGGVDLGASVSTQAFRLSLQPASCPSKGPVVPHSPAGPADPAGVSAPASLCFPSMRRLERAHVSAEQNTTQHKNNIKTTKV